MNIRRSSIQILGEILRLGEAGKTEIMYSVNMSYAQLERYLNFLVGNGFLERFPGGRNGGSIYRCTEKGRELLRCIETLGKLLGWEEFYFTEVRTEERALV